MTIAPESEAIPAEDEPNRAARLLRLMLRDGSVVPLFDECDVARGLVARGLAEWSNCLRIAPTEAGLASAVVLEIDNLGRGET